MPRVLVVDDSATDRTLIGTFLERQSDCSVSYAGNGDEALRAMQSSLPDLVLTDMQMPSMDGLELVTEIRRSHPHVPVILITGHGSEALAAKALQSGAASYVPKARFKDLLVATIQEVLRRTNGDAAKTEAIHHRAHHESLFTLETDPELIGPLLDFIQGLLAKMQLCDATGLVQVGIALEQALSNAIYHGNLELTAEESQLEISRCALVEQRLADEKYSSRRIQVKLTVTPEEARIIIQDDGPGFDVKAVSKVSLASSHDTATSRGLVLMWALMDKVLFNAAGNQVTLVKRRQEHAPAEQPAAAPVAEVKEEQQEIPLPGGLQVLGTLKPKRGGRPIRLTRRRVVLGRGPTCNIVLGHPDVSLRHCLLFIYDGWWHVRDLGSSEGTFVDYTAVKQTHISPGSTLSLGGHHYEVDYDLAELGGVGIIPPVDPPQ